MSTQPVIDNIGNREYLKFRKSADNNYAVAVTIVDAVAGTVLYDSAEFIVATGTTDYNIATNQGAAFNRVPTANNFIIRSDHNISIKLNTVGDPAITVATVDSPFSLTGIPVTNIFITNNSGSNANVKLLLT
jgi:hypothetical protein